MKIKIEGMTHYRSTKNTHVYIVQDTDAAIEQIYVKKKSLPEPPPQEINITIDTTEFEDIDK